MLPDIVIFGLLILLIDIPFVKWVVAPKYYSMNLALKPILIFALCAYFFMILSWVLIKGDVFKGFLTGLITYGTYAFTLAAILPGYTLSTGLTEVIWGSLLFTIATFLTNKIKSV